MATNDEIKPEFIRQYCYDCSGEVANYGEHNADHTTEDIPYYSKKQLDEVRANTMKTDKLILENAIEEAYRKLHNEVYSVNELAFGTRILESIRKMCKADYELCNSPKGYYTKIEREKKVKTDTAKEIFDFYEKWNASISDFDEDRERSQKEMDKYFSEKEKLLKKYNYEI